jgi:hypothetical protein
MGDLVARRRARSADHLPLPRLIGQTTTDPKLYRKDLGGRRSRFSLLLGAEVLFAVLTTSR